MLFLTNSLISGKFSHNWTPYNVFCVCYFPWPTPPFLQNVSGENINVDEGIIIGLVWWVKKCKGDKCLHKIKLI